ncbi:hypothetical protein PSHT_02990, partial [Puccinia striiformis]
MDRWLVIRMIVPMTSPDAFVARSNLVPSAILWGPDFDGWNSSYLHIDSKPWFAQVTELSQQGNGVVIMDRPHEMRELRIAEFYNWANVTLVLAPYAYELFEYRSEFATQALLVHQPHFIDKIFYHPVADTRPEDIIPAGDLGAFYPSGARLADMIRKKTFRFGYVAINDTKISNRPINETKNLPPKSKNNKSVSSPIHDGHTWYKNMPKQLQPDRQKTFEKVIVSLSNKDSDEKIIKTLKWWLTHDQERNSKAQADQDWILNSFSMDRYAEDVWKMVWQVKEGHSGMILPYKFDFFVTIDSSKDQIDKLQLVVINVDDNCSILWMVPCLTLGSVLARFLKAPAGVFEAVGPEHHSRTNFWNSKARS